MALMENRPSKRTTVVLLIVGLAVAVPAYLVVQHFVRESGMDVGEYGRAWSSFDAAQIEQFHRGIVSGGGLDAYRNGLIADYGFQVGYALALFSIALLIVRSLKRSVRLRRMGFLLPSIGLGVAVLDFVETTLIALTLAAPVAIPAWIAISHSVAIYALGVLLYGYLLGLAAILTVLLVEKARRRRTA